MCHSSSSWLLVCWVIRPIPPRGTLLYISFIDFGLILIERLLKTISIKSRGCLGGICWGGGTVLITCSSAALFYVYLPPLFSVVCVSGWRVWHAQRGRIGEDLTVLHQLIIWTIKNLQSQLISARFLHWIGYSELQQLGASDVFFFDQPVPSELTQFPLDLTLNHITSISWIFVDK